MKNARDHLNEGTTRFERWFIKHWLRLWGVVFLLLLIFTVISKGSP